MHCGDQRHLGLCLGYVPALAYGSCRVSDQGTTLRASDLHNARATILNPFNKTLNSAPNTPSRPCMRCLCELSFAFPQSKLRSFLLQGWNEGSVISVDSGQDYLKSIPISCEIILMDFAPVDQRPTCIAETVYLSVLQWGNSNLRAPSWRPPTRFVFEL